MTLLEREIEEKLRQATDMMLGARPAERFEDYLALHARLQVLRELKDFITERNKRAETSGDIDDDE